MLRKVLSCTRPCNQTFTNAITFSTTKGLSRIRLQEKRIFGAPASRVTFKPSFTQGGSGRNPRPAPVSRLLMDAVKS